MAQKRMFAKSIIDSDMFLDMPQSTQLLYFHLGMRADDDGFIDNIKSILRNTQCKEDDLKLLIAKAFVIPFESGVIVIRHWRQHNNIQKDRYKETKYINEKRQLKVDKSGMYTECIQNVSNMDTQYRLDKYRLDEVSTDKYISAGAITQKFAIPSIEEIEAYCAERQNNINAHRFYDFYTSKGWYVGKNKMTDWKASIRLWEKNSQSNTSNQTADKQCADWMTQLDNYVDGTENY
jgi:hypothetical protein